MRTWKCIAGMLSILFSFLVMLQSALSGVFNLITQNGEMSGTAGLLVVEPHFISEKNKEKLQNKKANGWRVMPYSTA